MDTWGLTSSELSENVKRKYLNLAKNIVTSQKNNFIDAVLQVFLVPQIKEQTWAIDVLNEPEGLENNVDQRRKNTMISWDDLVEYIVYALQTLKTQTGLKVSCGFQESSGMLKAKNKIESLVDFFDFHKYDDQGNLPRYDSLGISKPCIVGECGQKTKTWDDNMQKNAVKGFLENSKNLGYSGCFLWEYGFLGADKTNPEKSWCLVNPDGTHRPVINDIQNFQNNGK